MERSRIGGGLLTAVAVSAPGLTEMMGLTVSAPVGWALLALCGIAFVVGLSMSFWPDMVSDGNKPKRPQGPIGIYIEDSSDVITEGNIIEGFDNPIVDIGGTNNRHTNNIMRKGRKKGR